MEIMKIFAAKAKDNMNEKAPTIAFLGDSVTQGCFEVYRKSDDAIETVYDKNHAYHNYIAKIFSVLFPTVPVNIINAGISGDSAPHGLERVERDVLCHKPDLVVVCYGLNDCGGATTERYEAALNGIFEKIKEANAEIIFMTPNMMNTYVDYSIDDELIKGTAERIAKRQNDGVLEKFLDAAKKVCKKHNVKVCDCYSKWKRMYENGVDVTNLLSNKINHPTRELNWLFAYSLVEAMMILSNKDIGFCVGCLPKVFSAGGVVNIDHTVRICNPGFFIISLG